VHARLVEAERVRQRLGRSPADLPIIPFTKFEYNTTDGAFPSSSTASATTTTSATTKSSHHHHHNLLQHEHKWRTRKHRGNLTAGENAFL
jgi:hypothetical protein